MPMPSGKKGKTESQFPSDSSDVLTPIPIKTVRGIEYMDPKEVDDSLLDRKIEYRSWEEFARERHIAELPAPSSKSDYKIIEKNAKLDRSLYYSWHRHLKNILSSLGLQEGNFYPAEKVSPKPITHAVGVLYSTLFRFFQDKCTTTQIQHIISILDINQKIFLRVLIKNALYSVDNPLQTVQQELISFEKAVSCPPISEPQSFPIYADVVIDAARYIQEGMPEWTSEEEYYFYEKMNYDYIHIFRSRIIDHAYGVLEEVRKELSERSKSSRGNHECGDIQ